MTKTPKSMGLSRRNVLKGAAAGGLLIGTSGIAAAGNKAGEATYEVTIENLTSDTPTESPPAAGQWFTPPVIATHRPSTGMFTVGEPASFEVKEIAENGNLGPMQDALVADKHVGEFVVAAVDDNMLPPPLAPGNYVSVDISGDRGRKYLSFVSMLICTNDGFTGVDTIRLPKKVGDTVTMETDGYDAGTEMNTEDFADMVPPCPGLSGVETDDMGTGTSDPTIAEDEVIRKHPGIRGGVDLAPLVHGWEDPVGRITIERID
jgi:hypothetical protein